MMDAAAACWRPAAGATLEGGATLVRADAGPTTL